jgi:hypothetical protein
LAIPSDDYETQVLHFATEPFAEDTRIVGRDAAPVVWMRRHRFAAIRQITP